MANIKKKIYEYDHKGKYIRFYESQGDVLELYFKEDKGKRPLLTNNQLGYNYRLLEDTILFEKRVYRDDIFYLIEIHNSDFCKKIDGENNTPIEVFNIKQEKIAEAKNLRLALLLFKQVPRQTIYAQLTGSKKQKRYSKSGLFFRYKLD